MPQYSLVKPPTLESQHQPHLLGPYLSRSWGCVEVGRGGLPLLYEPVLFQSVHLTCMDFTPFSWAELNSWRCNKKCPLQCVFKGELQVSWKFQHPYLSQVVSVGMCHLSVSVLTRGWLLCQDHGVHPPTPQPWLYLCTPVPFCQV